MATTIRQELGAASSRSTWEMSPMDENARTRDSEKHAAKT